MSYYWSSEIPESSQQGTLSMLQQDLQGYIAGTDEKFSRLQEQIEKLVIGLNRRNGKQHQEPIYSIDEKDFKENISPGSFVKGLFKDPQHAASQRQRLVNNRVLVEEEPRVGGQYREHYTDNQSLKHLKLAFPVFNLVSKLKSQNKEVEFKNPLGWKSSKALKCSVSNKKDGTEKLHRLKLSFPKFKEGIWVTKWVQDCEHYFEVAGIDEEQKVSIASIHLEGVAREWYQAYAVGRSYIDWNDFSIQFSTRFGVLEQKLVYDKCQQLKKPQSFLMTTEKEEIEDYQESPKYDKYPEEEDSGVFDGEPQLTDVGIRSKAQEWPKLAEELPDVEPIYGAAPTYDEDPRDNQTDPHEQELILAALQGNSSAFSKPLEFDGEVEGKPVLSLIDGDNTAEPVVTLSPPNDNHICSQGQSTIITGQRTGVELSTMAHLVQWGNWLSQLDKESCNYRQQLVHLPVPKQEEQEASCAQLSKVVPLWLQQISDKLKVDAKSTLVDNKDAEKQDVVEEESLKFLGELVEDSPTVLHSASLGIQLDSYKKVHIFYPGGWVQNEQSTCVFNRFKERAGKQGNLNEVSILYSVGGQPGQWQIVKPAELQGQDVQTCKGETDRIISKMNQQNVDSMEDRRNVILHRYQYMVMKQTGPDKNKTLKPKCYEVSRIEVTIYIFDPGGVLSCLQGVLVDSPECIQKEWDRQWRSESSTMRTWFIFKKGGLSGLILTSTSVTCDLVVLSATSSISGVSVSKGTLVIYFILNVQVVVYKYL